MSALVTIICGPARSGKTERLLALYRDALRRRPPESTLWLAPTWRAATEIRDRLLDGELPGCFAPGVTTFDKFAVEVLRKAGKPIRQVTPLMKRELLRRIIDQQASRQRLKHFLPIAKTAGLIDLVCEFIGELKRLEIWPEDFQRACEQRGLTDKDTELFEFYQEYQQALREHGLFDAEGRFWSARDELRKAEDEGLAASAASCGSHLLVVADGFTDFTRTQHEILDSLAARAEEMFITLPLEGEPRRADMFAKPLKTLDALRRRRSNVVVEQLERPTKTAWPAMARLEPALFENPRGAISLAAKAASPRDTEPPLGIEILAAARQIGEIEMIAARIKRLLIDRRASPDEIAVVFRSPQETAELVREAFERLEIPAAFESGQALERRPALRALANLLQLDLEDWPFDRLLAVLGSNYFQPDWQAAGADEVERAIRKLQIPRGRARLIEQLAPAGDASYSTTLAVVNRLAVALDALPQRATLPDWAEAWERLAKETGLLRAVDQDIVAWQRLMKVLADSGKLAGWLHCSPTEMDRRTAFETLLDILGSDLLDSSDDESGRVRVLSATSVRSLRIPHLFLAGLSEKVFPPPDREDRLYGEQECLRLIDAGLPLVARTERTRDEMLLFYEAVTRATERLYLSYPALDEAAQPLLPSPFLGQLEQAFGPGQITRVEQTDLSPVPRDDEPLSAAEFRVKAVATALEGNVALLAGLMGGGGLAASAASSRIAAGLKLLYSRQDRERFGPTEGVLRGATARRELAAEFSAQRTYSATELERYAYCPFRFFMERILKIEPVEDLALEFDVLGRGRVAHEVLADFHRRVNRRLGRPASPLELDTEEFDALVAEAVQNSLPPEPSNPVKAAMREIDRRLVVEWMSRYREQVEKYDAQWKGFDTPPVPELFEVAFGRGNEGPPSTDKPLEFLREGETIRISGRIDRVDVGVVAGRGVFNVLDYKTGGSVRVKPESVRAGTTLQLPLYSLAAMELLLADRDMLPWRAGYWYVRDDGYKPRQALRMYFDDDGRIELDPTWEELRAGLGDTVAELVHAMRRGCFPVCCADDRCTGRCPYGTVCRVNHIRSLEKTCRPTDND